MRKLVALLLAVFLLMSVAACTQEVPGPTIPEEPVYMPESTLELWEKINKKMDSLDSMEMTISTQKVYYEKGYQYKQSATSYVLTTRDIHYTRTVSVLNCSDIGLLESREVMEAYYQGKMYRAVSDGEYTQKFCSEMSHQDYDDLQNGGPAVDLAIADCTKGEFSKTENGLWQLSFSGYTKKTVDQAMQTLGLAESTMGKAVTDMQVNITANADFLVTDMQIVFLFDEGEVAPEFSVTTQYSNWNTAVFDNALLKVEEYTPVKDVYLLDTIAGALAQRQNANIGQFMLESKTTETYGDQIRESEEKGVIIYGWKNNAYTYFFTANMGQQSVMVKYQNGVQTVISNNQSYTAEKTDAEAKAYIDGLIDSANYTPIAITTIEKLQDGSYVLLTDQPDIAGYIDGIVVEKASQRIVVSFADGEVERIESRLTIEGTYEEKPITIQTDSVVTFAANAEFPEA